jgi:hypothetical protein
MKPRRQPREPFSAHTGGAPCQAVLASDEIAQALVPGDVVLPGVSSS